MKTLKLRFFAVSGTAALFAAASALCQVAAAADAPELAPPRPAHTTAPAAPGARPARPPRRGLPPEAFTQPTNFVALVNVARANGDAVPQDWLEKQAASMQRSLKTGFMAVRVELPDDGDALPALRALASRVMSTDFADKGFPDGAKLAVILDAAPGMPPIIASPYEGWSAMDAGWVRRGGGDDKLQAERMGKRVWQALGALCGASYRPEREAVMRYCPTPESLDDCLSHNFHPLNANAFSTVARAAGLSPVRLRPRAELEALGIIKPRGKHQPAPEAKPAASESPMATDESDSAGKPAAK